MGAKVLVFPWQLVPPAPPPPPKKTYLLFEWSAQGKVFDVMRPLLSAAQPMFVSFFTMNMVHLLKLHMSPWPSSSNGAFFTCPSKVLLVLWCLPEPQTTGCCLSQSLLWDPPERGGGGKVVTDCTAAIACPANMLVFYYVKKSSRASFLITVSIF